jgi:MinD-like ATPase involved in chromosome partitioning or flagellar assembly
MDNTVLLIDANVARPSVLSVLGLSPEPGLADILLHDETSLADVILRTNVPGLNALPAGGCQTRHRVACQPQYASPPD